MVKRTLIMLCIAVSLVALSACDDQDTTTSLEALDIPDNLVIEGAMVSWDAIEGADAYDVYVNDTPITTTDTHHMFDEEGNYDIYIIATGEGYGDSKPSGTLTFTLEFADEVSFATEETDEGIRWDAVDEALSYLVYVDGQIFETEDTSFSFESVDAGLLDVRIQAVYPIGMSDVSDITWIEHRLKTAPDMYFQYSTHSTQDIIVFGIDGDADIQVLDMDGKPLDGMEVFSANPEPRIRSSFVLDSEEETKEFFLIADAMKHRVSVGIHDKQVPYIISSSVVHTDGAGDERFQFELFGGSFQQISGTDLTSDDYHMDGHVLTIDADYIAGRFAETARFSINYALSGDELVIGYIDFQKNT